MSEAFEKVRNSLSGQLTHKEREYAIWNACVERCAEVARTHFADSFIALPVGNLISEAIEKEKVV